MTRIAPRILRSYLLGGYAPSRQCLRASQSCARGEPRSRQPPRSSQSRSVHQDARTDVAVPFRKHLKDEAKKRKDAGSPTAPKRPQSTEWNKDWELTVGIEIHAQLNTARKLFSSAASTVNDEPNTQVRFFDLAIPGSQPIFQRATLIPALRAALALNCDVQRTSRFDRKHYFHWDQPAGYQITQYYEPFAKDGYITLYAHDGIAKEDGEEVRIGIKQVQMEQDTAKTLAQPGDVHLLDFNRVGLPLIEIITLPQLHYPSTAAALVRKIQFLLNAVDACVLGMESGGLRADVNVSVRRRDNADEDKGHEYAGVRGLGQRTEIKNLGSIKAVRDAIIAERDRQIEILENGGRIDGETRGWTLGSSETRRLRGKEGEVDYRYMPDPDLAPVIIGEDLLEHLQKSMVLPEQELKSLTETYGLTMKDAMSLVALDDGGRAQYFYNVVEELTKMGLFEDDLVTLGRTCGNWVLHELGGLTEGSSDPNDGLSIDLEGNCVVPAKTMAQIILHLEMKGITGKTAKALLASVYNNERRGISREVHAMINDGNLWLRPMSDEEYETLARSFIDSKIVRQIRKGQDGKVMYLVGQMMRNGEEGQIEPQKAESVIRAIINGWKD